MKSVIAIEDIIMIVKAIEYEFECCKLIRYHG